MASNDFVFKNFMSIAPDFIRSADAFYVQREPEDFEPFVENAAGDVIHLPLQRGSDKFYINSGSRTYSVSLFYHFPEDVRDNEVTYTTSKGKRPGTYGADNMSFRRLYEILCRKFNNENYFIDEYFNEIDWSLQDNETVKEQVSQVLDGVQDYLAEYEEDAARWLPRNVSGKLDMRYKASREFMASLKGRESAAISTGLRDVSERVKADIVQKLMLGQIPLSNPALTEATKKRKASAGFSFPDSKFYATGQLINSINIDFYVWSN